MKGMTFDQVERYRGASLVLTAILEESTSKNLKVLDLGGFFKTLEGKSLLPLPMFHPELDCTVADIPACDDKNYVQLKETTSRKLPFKDRFFDVVVCMDVLEHVPYDSRMAFVSEACRVCKQFLILAAPFHQSYRVNADKWLAELQSILFNEANEMLQEHLDNGLPDAQEFEAHLNAAGLPFLSFENNELRDWRLTMALKHLSLFSWGPKETERLDKDISALAAPVVLDGPGYRDVYVVAQSSNLSPVLESVKNAIAKKKRILKSSRKKQPGESLETLCGQYFQRIATSLNQFTAVVESSKNKIKTLKTTALADQRKQKLLKMKLHQIALSNRKILLDIREKDIYISQMQAESQTRETAVIRHIKNYEQTLTELKSSAVYKTGKIVLAPVKFTAKLVKQARLLLSQNRGQVIKCSETIVTENKITSGEGQVRKIVDPSPESQITPVNDPRLHTLSKHITFSILVPVYNTDEQVLREMIDSVLRQSYPYWQLCLVDDASPDQTPRDVINEYARKYPDKIHVECSKTNGGIAVATRKASALATGEFVCLLDHDDLLTDDALMEVARQLEVTPDVDYIYSDEDKVSQDGSVFMHPYHKPDFDPELLLCNNYLNHFSVIRKSLFNAIGGYREGFDGSQDYDLYLRVTEKAQRIAHIPKILYHWRMVPDSTAVDPAAKGGLFRESSFKVLESAIERRGLNAVVEKGLSPGTYRVRYAVEPGQNVSIIIPTRDAGELVEQCVATIRQHTRYPDYEIVVVDNGTTDPATLDYLTQQSGDSDRFRVVQYDHRFNFSEINNYAVQQTNSPYLVFMNNDIEITDDGWLTAMLEHGQKEAVGAVGAKLLYSDERIQHAGVILGQGGVAGHPFKGLQEFNGAYFGHSNLVKNYSAVTAACLLTRRDVFDEVGGFNPELAVSFGDIDLCMEIRRLGYRIVYTPYARMIHHESVSRLDDNDAPRRPRFHSEITYMISKWGGALYNDPYLNPNLSILRYDMGLRAPEENETIDAYCRAFRGFNPNNE